ncbi:MAG TPA: preprotein translocase subunit SecG [Nitrospiria bacterium]
MYVFLVGVHVLVSFIMIGVILLQAGKGAEMGATFGGSSQTLFGSRGAGGFLSKMTIAAAVIFMVTSLSLSILSKGRFISTSVIDMKQKPAVEAPAAGPVEAGPAGSPVTPAEGQPAAP